MSHKRKAASSAIKSPVGGDKVVVKVAKKCPACTVSLAAIEVRDTYTLDDLGDKQEWNSGNGDASPACIQMDTTLDFRLYLDVAQTDDDQTYEGLTLEVTLTISPECGDSRDETLTYADITLDGTEQYWFGFQTDASLCEGIDVTNVELKGFSLTGSDDVTFEDPGEISMDVFTIFDAPLRDNVKQSTLVDGDANEDNDEVSRLQEFFTVDHVRQTCKWAAGESKHRPTDGIVQNIIRNIPKITYGEKGKYHAENDGWNVWDNPKKRTADCSQLASFFADVLGTIGIRGHDLELKCDVIHDGTRYRRAFGDKPGWPTHGVLLINYQNSGHYCYDTTFSWPRKICRLRDATIVGKDRFVDKWFEWWELGPGNQPRNVNVPKKIQTALNTTYDAAWWATDILRIAGNLFPDGEEQTES